MRRRAFITLLGGAAMGWPVAARAQQPAMPVRIGLMASEPLPPQQRFSRRLQEHGYLEGRNVQLEWRFAEGRDERFSTFAAEGTCSFKDFWR